MNPSDKHSSQMENNLKEWIGNILRIGLVISTVLVLGGGMLFLHRHGGEPWPDFTKFKGEPEELKNISQMAKSAFSYHSREIIQLGLLCLIATPILRMILSIGLYARQRDILYVIITTTALCLLLGGLIFLR